MQLEFFFMQCVLLTPLQSKLKTVYFVIKKTV